MMPALYQIKSIEHETHSIFTLTLSKQDDGPGMSFLPGQFNMLYQYGFGEVAISISGDPSKSGPLVHTIQAVGSVTNSLQKLQPGDWIGVRGPYGTHWPIANHKGDVLVIAGGVGLAPLRSALYQLAAQKKPRQKITVLYGTRTPEDIVYRKDMEQWKQQGIDIEVTVDHADEHWPGHVGVVTTLIGKNLPDPERSLVCICGPEIMMKYAILELMHAKINENNIYLAMERNMQCAVGFCGHCQYGPYFICKDGPIFSYSKLKYWLAIKEL